MPSYLAAGRCKPVLLVNILKIKSQSKFTIDYFLVYSIPINRQIRKQAFVGPLTTTFVLITQTRLQSNHPPVDILPKVNENVAM